MRPSLPRTPSCRPGLPPASAPPQRPDWAGPEARGLGRYRLGPSLGRGGMGEVFEAWDTLLNRRVALKTLTAPHPAAILRFLREAQLQGRVSHPNVCRIFDVDAAGDLPVIAMQLVRGPNLLQAAPGLALEEGVEILAAVAAAIHAAHRLDLIHRDLKPSNILLEPDGMGGWNSYVADFGLAKDLAEASLTQSQGPLGTLEYLAPELQPGRGGTASPASDIYALGVTLRTVACLARGRSPEPGPGAVPALAVGPARWRALPRRLRVILDRCLEERPGDRYPSSGALAEDLRRFLDGEPLLAERGQWRRGAARLARRRPTLVVALGLGLLMGAGFLGWTRAATFRSRRQLALAQHFALEARDLENRLWVERLTPAHDLRPAMARTQEGLDRVRAEMARLGSEAQGPGNLALGRVYCYLGDPKQARLVLDAAWQGGYRTPEVAYALSRAACFAYFRLLDRADMGDLEEPLEPALAVHRRDARAYFDQSRGQGWESSDLGESRLAYLEGDFARSVRHARAAFHQHPWLYEAKQQEAFSLDAMGVARQKQGQFAAARSLYQEASLAAQVARSIGRSDPSCYLSDMEWRFHWLQNPNLSHAERMAQLRAAELLADRLLELQPDSPRSICSKVFVLVRRAGFLAERGLDPEPDLRRAERLLDPAAERPACRRMVALKRRQIQEIRRR